MHPKPAQQWYWVPASRSQKAPFVAPGQEGEPLQAPPLQVWPAGHATPQKPQLRGSVSRSGQEWSGQHCAMVPSSAGVSSAAVIRRTEAADAEVAVTRGPRSAGLRAAARRLRVEARAGVDVADAGGANASASSAVVRVEVEVDALAPAADPTAQVIREGAGAGLEIGARLAAGVTPSVAQAERPRGAGRLGTVGTGAAVEGANASRALLARGAPLAASPAIGGGPTRPGRRLIRSRSPARA